MKIGDKVRFLSEVGGGKVAGFKGNNIVLVEDEDGFEIPMPIKEVVVIGEEDYSTSHVISKKGEKQKPHEAAIGGDTRSIKQLMQEGQDEEVDLSVPDEVDLSKEVTYKKKIEERKGGNQLSAYLAFSPMDDKQITEPNFEVYFVNDSNYFMRFVILSTEGNSCMVWHDDVVEPNTKLFLREIGRQDINSLDRLGVQLIAFKRDQPFTRKPAVDVTLRIDPVKFFKIHTFEDTDFFEHPVLLYTIVENDVPVRPLVIDAKTLKHEMYKSADAVREENGSRSARHTQIEPSSLDTAVKGTMNARSELVTRYTPDQRKGGHSASPRGRYRGLDDAVVVDLHIDQLLDTTAGMTPAAILDYQLNVFHETLAHYAKKKGQKLIFIHGKGQGVLRKALINELRYKYKNYPYQDASFQEYGYGATQVTIK